jgi:hypothetical protein
VWHRWSQLLALHDKGGGLDPSAGDIEDDALADESITLGLNDLEDVGDGEEGQGGSERQVLSLLALLVREYEY